jgi:hypothetical protein
MRRWWRRLQRADRRVVDRWIAAAFVLIGEIEALLQGGGDQPLMLAALAVGYSMLAWRRTQPVVAGAGMFATWIAANTRSSPCWRCATRWAPTRKAARRWRRRS